MFSTAQTSPIPCYLPPEVIFEILSYLPPKVLIPFMTVCKAWNSTIRSQQFIKSHYDRSMKTNSRTIVIVQHQYDPDFASVDLDRDDEFSNFVRIKLPFRRAIVLGYCNGLVYINYELGFAVWNPLIQRYKTIPSTAIELPAPADCMKSTVMHGFGYDSTNDDYKLLKVVQFTNLQAGHEAGSEVKIYSLKSNSWRKIQSLPCMEDFRIYPSEDSHLLFLNGALHWLICHKSDEKIKRVVSLDLATEKYDDFPIPPMDLKYSAEVLLDVSAGYLCVCGIADPGMPFWRLKLRDDLWKFWIMKEYGVAASWTRSHTHDTKEYKSRKCYSYCKPSETREMVLLQFGNKMPCPVCWYDLERKEIKYINIQDKAGSYDFSTAICVGNLRLLDGDSCTLDFLPEH